jgi:hypothetical protein
MLQMFKESLKLTNKNTAVNMSEPQDGNGRVS